VYENLAQGKATRVDIKTLEKILHGFRSITSFILADKLRSAAPQAREVMVSAARTESVLVPTPSKAG